MTGIAFEVRLEPGRFDPGEELRKFLERLNGNGAAVSFVGIARPKDCDGNTMHSLYLDYYAGMTEASLAAILSDARQRFAIGDATVVHRCGYVAAGDPIVFTAAAAPHRRAAFLAADYLMDRLKTEAVFWKREDGAEGSHWIEPTEQDYADRQRWD